MGSRLEIIGHHTEYLKLESNYATERVRTLYIKYGLRLKRSVVSDVFLVRLVKCSLPADCLEIKPKKRSFPPSAAHCLF